MGRRAASWMEAGRRRAFRWERRPVAGRRRSPHQARPTARLSDDRHRSLRADRLAAGWRHGTADRCGSFLARMTVMAPHERSKTGKPGEPPTKVQVAHFRSARIPSFQRHSGQPCQKATITVSLATKPRAVPMRGQLQATGRQEPTGRTTKPRRSNGGTAAPGRLRTTGNQEPTGSYQPTTPAPWLDGRSRDAGTTAPRSVGCPKGEAGA